MIHIHELQWINDLWNVLTSNLELDKKDITLKQNVDKETR